MTIKTVGELIMYVFAVRLIVALYALHNILVVFRMTLVTGKIMVSGF